MSCPARGTGEVELSPSSAGGGIDQVSFLRSRPSGWSAHLRTSERSVPSGRSAAEIWRTPPWSAHSAGSTLAFENMTAGEAVTAAIKAEDRTRKEVVKVFMIEERWFNFKCLEVCVGSIGEACWDEEGKERSEVCSSYTSSLSRSCPFADMFTPPDVREHLALTVAMYHSWSVQSIKLPPLPPQILSMDRSWRGFWAYGCGMDDLHKLSTF